MASWQLTTFQPDLLHGIGLYEEVDAKQGSTPECVKNRCKGTTEGQTTQHLGSCREAGKSVPSQQICGACKTLAANQLTARVCMPDRNV